MTVHWDISYYSHSSYPDLPVDTYTSNMLTLVIWCLFYPPEHLPYHVASVPSLRWVIRVRTSSFLLLYNFTGRLAPPRDLHKLSIQLFFFSYYSKPFLSKEMLSSVPLGYPNCQQHCYCPPGALLSQQEVHFMKPGTTLSLQLTWNRGSY